jgi:hypothetical protein
MALRIMGGEEQECPFEMSKGALQTLLGPLLFCWKSLCLTYMNRKAFPFECLVCV